MNFRLEKIQQLSGSQASVYSVVLEGQPDSVFDQFLDEWDATYPKELDYIVNTLKIIGHQTGARESFFKQHEGKMNDLLCALYDDPDRHLRLYCIRWGRDFVILGGGGPKDVAAWQDDDNLSHHARQMIQVAKQVHERFEEKDLYWTAGYKDISGNLVFNDEEDE